MVSVVFPQPFFQGLERGGVADLDLCEVRARGLVVLFGGVGLLELVTQQVVADEEGVDAGKVAPDEGIALGRRFLLDKLERNPAVVGAVPLIDSGLAEMGKFLLL